MSITRITMFQTSDGKKHETEDAAIAHQNKVDVDERQNKLKRLIVDSITDLDNVPDVIIVGLARNLMTRSDDFAKLFEKPRSSMTFDEQVAILKKSFSDDGCCIPPSVYGEVLRAIYTDPRTELVENIFINNRLRNTSTSIIARALKALDDEIAKRT